MTTAMKLTTGILAIGMVVTAGAAFAQTPDAIDNARSTAKALQQSNGTTGSATSKQYYTEVPFDMELDGPYYSVLNFFDRVSKLERIVNISNLLVSTSKKPADAKVKHTYQYAPNESVVTSFTATTYFSHDTQPSAASTGTKPGTPAAK